MIVGIGTDICNTKRIQAAFQRHGHRFARRILGEHEWLVFLERTEQSLQRGTQFLASRFAIKEAFSKAIGTGMRQPMGWQVCETISNTAGKPELLLSGSLREWFNANKWRAHVSVSDDNDYVLAFVLVEETNF